ncbi:MAG TPA: class IV adenylate cyclase [Methanomassiliicoccales archaeon]|nr:class IV adenylate cyclase [Methanomassiliicoccales archaeon]
MLEIEVKTRIEDARRLENELLKRGARDFGVALQRDVYYSHPARDFASTDEALRIRISNDLQVITYKGPKLDATTKTREEIEVSVASAEATAKILERLGFRPVVAVEKKRHTFGLRGIEICVDRVRDLGDYVEFELDDEEMEEGKRRIAELMEELGVKGSERRSYLELLLEK